MGFFSKIFKGVKKVFKKIGKGIKKNVMRFGKFMDKIGIVGQIAMSFILPGIGGALLKGLGGALGKVGAWAATAGGNALVQGAKAVIGTATKFITQGARVFNTVTSGIKNFASEITKTALNKIPGITVEGASKTFFGTDGSIFGANGALGKAATATGKTWNTTIGSSKWMKQFDPLAEAKGLQSQITDIVSESTGFKPATALPEDFKYGSKLPEGFTPATVGQPTSLLGAPVAPPTVSVDAATFDYNTMYSPQVTPAPEAVMPKGADIDYESMYSPASTNTDTGFRFYEEAAAETAGLTYTGKAVTGAFGEGVKQVASTAITDYLTPDEPAPRPYAEVVNLGQMSVAESEALDYGSGFGFNRIQQDYLRSMPTYVPRNTWQTRMMS